MKLTILLTLLLGWTTNIYAQVRAIDDLGNAITLDKPATRIISLAPSITELLYATGAGNQLIGVVSYSDYPEAAKQLPIVGSYKSPDYERIIASDPDLIVAWPEGNGINHIEKLKSLGFTVYANESRNFSDVSRALRNLGILTGHPQQGEEVAINFEKQLATLQQQYQHRPPIEVFYQIWNEPMLSINGEHIISKVIEMCGGKNIFAHIDNLVPRLNIEAVLQANPEVIVASGMGNKRPTWLSEWQRWEQMRAVNNQHVYYLNADLINRPTPRLQQAVQQMCELLEQVRQKRGDQ